MFKLIDTHKTVMKKADQRYSSRTTMFDTGSNTEVGQVS